MSMNHLHEYFVYAGAARGDNGDEGIYIYKMDMDSGDLRPIDVVNDISNPSFLAIHPSHRFLYAIDEDRSKSPSEAGVSAFAIDPETGGLTHINRQLSHGRGLCHIIVDHEGKNVLTAHYGGGTVSVLPILDDGRLGEATAVIQHEGSGVHTRQEAPHPHSIFVDPNNKFALVPDLGLDKVMVYRFDADRGTLEPAKQPSATVSPGSGPRHFAFHPNGEIGYVINELSSTITAFDYDGTQGLLTEIQTISTLPEDYKDESWTAEILVHPSGRFVYGSNRGHDSIAIFSVNPDRGTLSLVGFEPTQGGHPRNFAMDPTGTFLYAENRDSNNIVVFRIDSKTGRLDATGHITEMPRPVCIKMIAAG